MHRKYGLIKQKSDPRDRVYSVPRHLTGQLPTSIDLRPKMPPVYDQGQLGSCTANAIAGAYEYGLIIETTKNSTAIIPFAPSRLFIYFNEREMEGTIGTDAGAEIRDGIKSVNKLGVCPETEWPYIESKFAHRPTAKDYKDALKHTASSYEAIDNTDLSAIKGALAEGLPVVMGFTVYNSFESDAVAKTGILNMPAKHEQQLGGHAVVIAGYDDAMYASAGGFIIRNSWGNAWGQKGYFTMPYAYATDTHFATDFWAIKVCD